MTGARLSEAYLQWVLEDTLISGRPQLDTVAVPVHLQSQSMAVKVQFTDDVAPYEKLKMRLLNGSHSALAYVAYLMGFRIVDEPCVILSCVALCSGTWTRSPQRFPMCPA